MKRKTPDRKSDALFFGAFPLSAVLALMVTPACADVTSSGLGTSINSPAAAGTTYNITGGTPAGPNLFHSFGKFSLDYPQSATFQNPVNVSNVIGRVTGGNPSNIDGTIRSTGAANLYLINPAGMMFGPNAKLDVGGSFHASTADYISLGSETERFYADPAQTSVLAAAPPSAFGFLDAPAAIVVTTAREQPPEQWEPDLAVPTGATFSLVGGDITIGDDTTRTGPEIVAENGNIRLVAVSGAGEVPLDSSQPLDPGLAGGRIALYDTSLLVRTSGEDATPGSIQLQAGEIDLTRSTLSASTYSSVAGGTIKLAADRIALNEHSKITLNTYSSGTGGTLSVRAGDLLIQSGSQINSAVLNRYRVVRDESGNPVKDQNGQPVLELILPRTSGNGGELDIQAERSITVTGSESFRNDSGDFLSQISAISVGTGNDTLGDAGRIRIRSPMVQIRGGAQITSTARGSGQGGSIDLQTGALGLHGYGIFRDASGNVTDFFSSGIFANAQEGSGNGGSIAIDTDTLTLSGGAQIAASTWKTGAAGSISINANDISLSGSVLSPVDGAVNPTGVHASQQEGSTGDAGDIDITAHRILLRDGARIDAASATDQRSGNISLTLTGEDSLLDLDGQSKITALNGDRGESGSIDIRGAHTLRLTGNSGISLETALGNAGDIHIQADHLLYLLDSYITTSAALGFGNGGNIVIDPIFTVLNNSQIIANALQGNGGNIFITTQFLIQSIDSIISASSQFGLQGTVTVNSMDQNIAQSIAALPSNLLDASNLLQEDCASHTSGSTFTTAGRGRLPASPDDDLDITFLPTGFGGCGI